MIGDIPSSWLADYEGDQLAATIAKAWESEIEDAIRESDRKYRENAG